MAFSVKLVTEVGGETIDYPDATSAEVQGDGMATHLLLTSNSGADIEGIIPIGNVLYARVATS